MTAPALLPAGAFLVGILAGARLGPGDGRASVTVASLALATLAAGWIACVARRGRPSIVFALAAVALAGGGFGGRAARGAFAPPLLALFEQRAAVELERGPTSIRNSDRTWAAVLRGRLRRDARVFADAVVLDLDVDQIDGVPGTPRGGVLVTVGGSLASDHAPAWRGGRVIRLPVLLREASRYQDAGVPDHRADLRRRGFGLVGSVKSARLVEVVAHGPWWSEATAAARAWVRGQIARHVGRWSQQSAAIVTAVLAGDRAGLDPAVERRLQEAGTYHIIAISGGNIAILAGILMAGITTCGAGPRTARLGTIVALVGYAGFVGPEPSVTRATLMAVVYLGAGLADLRSPPLNAAGVAAVAALAASPLSVFEAGFALTFAATIGIIVLALRFGAHLPARQPWRALAALLLASVAAEAALLPIAASAFSRVTFAGLLLNYLAIPLMTVLQGAGMLALGLAWWPWAAGVAGWVAHFSAHLIVESAGLVAFAPWLSLRVPPPGILITGLYYCSLACALAPAGHGLPIGPRASTIGRLTGALVAVLSAVLIVWSPALRSTTSDGRLRVTWLDVGQGDAALIRWPPGETWLVDTGGPRTPDAGEFGGRVVSPALWALGVRRLGALVITHGDPDHAGGAEAVAADFRPRALWEGIVIPGLEPLETIRARMRARGGTVGEWRAGRTIPAGGATVEVLHPPVPDWERRQVRNDDSLVLDVRIGDVSVLLTGDIGASVEREVASRLRPAGIRVLKIPHHGSASSSSEAFLTAARPALAILSAGRGGWLGRDLLARYRARGIEIFRTDEDGAVSVITDGQTVEVSTLTGRRTVLSVPAPAAK